MSEYDACNRVAGQEFSNGPCGPKCNPLLCNGSPSTPPTEAPTKQVSYILCLVENNDTAFQVLGP